MAFNSSGTQKTLVATGVAAPGAITLTGAVVGDAVVAVVGQVTASQAFVASALNQFERTISVVNQIQQVAVGDLSANDYAFVLDTTA